jgi:hypothetical protein
LPPPLRHRFRIGRAGSGPFHEGIFSWPHGNTSMPASASRNAKSRLRSRGWSPCN